MPLSLADLFAYHADEAVRTVLTLKDQKDRESRLRLAQKWLRAAASLRALQPSLMSKDIPQSDRFNGADHEGKRPVSGTLREQLIFEFASGQLPLPIQKRVRRSSCAMLADVSATKRPTERALSVMNCIADNSK
jgi:hypothetical protein